MSPAAPLWLREADVCALLDLPAAIDALERGLALEAAGEAANLEKTHLALPHGGTLHALGAAIHGRDLAGVKSWAHTAGGAAPLLGLWDAAEGGLLAVIEAFALGQLRTAAVSGVATRWLALPEADVMAIVGTGKQALPQVAAVRAVRALRELRVFGRDAARRAAFAERARAAGLAGEVRETETVAEAVRGAGIVTLATRASEPFLEAGMLAPGAHVNAIGAITPDRAEVAQDVFPRCTALVADAPATALRLSRELSTWYGADADERPVLEALSVRVARRTPRPANADLTLFKAMGMGLSDVALGAEVLERARAADRGLRLPAAEPMAPRLR